MRRALLAACLLLGACGSIVDAYPPAVIQVRETCAGPLGARLEVEQGSAFTCSQGPSLSVLADTYTEAWGALDLTGWTIRVRASDTVGPGGVRGLTFFAARVIDLAPSFLVGLAHELHHVALGPASWDHEGWCADWYPWERSELGLDESAYLGCTAP